MWKNRYQELTSNTTSTETLGGRQRESTKHRVHKQIIDMESRVSTDQDLGIHNTTM